MSRITVIKDKMLEEFKLREIEDTPDNRIAFLTGIHAAWMEDESTSLEKSLYVFTILGMINIERIKLIGQK